MIRERGKGKDRIEEIGGLRWKDREVEKRVSRSSEEVEGRGERN